MDIYFYIIGEEEGALTDGFFVVFFRNRVYFLLCFFFRNRVHCDGLVNWSHTSRQYYPYKLVMSASQKILSFQCRGGRVGPKALSTFFRKTA